MKKPATYSWWREAVKTEMIRRGVVTQKGPPAERAVERLMRESESGPTACVPSPKELWEGGETPTEFVKHEFLSHLRTEATERRLIMSHLRKMVGHRIVSVEMKDGCPTAIVEGWTPLSAERRTVKFGAVPGHVEFSKPTPCPRRKDR